MGWVSTFREKLRMRTLKQMGSSDWAEVLSKTAQDISEAEHTLGRKKDAFDTAYHELVAINDQTGLARHRKGIREATEHLEELRHARERAQRALDEAIAREQQADLETRWRKAAECGFALRTQALHVQKAAEALVREFDAFVERGQEFRAALPELPGASNEATMMHGGAQALRALKVHLFVKSGGRLHVSGLISSPYELAQGPDFCQRTDESVTRALSHRPTTEPPEAA